MSGEEDMFVAVVGDDEFNIDGVVEVCPEETISGASEEDHCVFSFFLCDCGVCVLGV
jgi:hypothetical protein